MRLRGANMNKERMRDRKQEVLKEEMTGGRKEEGGEKNVAREQMLCFCLT